MRAGQHQAGIGTPQAAHQHQCHHGQQQHEVHAAIKAQAAGAAQGIDAGRGIGQIRFAGLAQQPGIDCVEQRQQRAHQEQRLGEDVAYRPEEIHPLEKAQEQRWIAQRRQRAAGIGDDEDEEHHHMHLVPAVVVGAQQRPDQQHRGARGPHEAGQHGADRQNGRVQPRRSLEIAAHIDAARHRVQRRQQDHERQVFSQQGMHQVGHGRAHAEHRREGQQKDQRPGGRHLAEMPVPEMGRRQRHQGD